PTCRASRGGCDGRRGRGLGRSNNQVEDLLQRVFVGINEEPAVDFHGRVGAHVEDLGIELFRARQLVSYAVLREKTENETCLLFLASGEKPYGHPPSLFHTQFAGIPPWTMIADVEPVTTQSQITWRSTRGARP